MNSISQNEFIYHDLHVILNIKIHKKFLRDINNEIPTMIKRLMKRRFIFNKCSKYCLSISIHFHKSDLANFFPSASHSVN